MRQFISLASPPTETCPTAFKVIFGLQQTDTKSPISAKPVSASHSRLACWTLLVAILFCNTAVSSHTTGPTMSGKGGYGV